MQKPSRVLALVSLPILLSGCSTLVDHAARSPAGDRAFITYWPAPEGGGHLRLAVKDNIDVRGVVTSAGSEYFAKNRRPATKDAPCLAIARQRHVHLVGKANLSEFAVAPSGANEYFGTPRNPFNRLRRRLPGGSSSGSAVAVANGEADVAFGTDTAGSVRVPAAWCGVVGLKTTHGLVPLDGVHPIEPRYLDTVGPLAKDIARTVQGMELLQSGFAARYAAAKARQPLGANIRIGRLALKGTDSKVDQAVDLALARAGFQVVPLGADLVEKWEQAKKDGNSVAAAGAWLSNREYRFKPGISARSRAAILIGQLAYETRSAEALGRRAAWKRTLRRIFTKVDFIALPTLQTTPLPFPPDLKIGLFEARMLEVQNTVAVNFAGNPALAVPIPLRGSSVPTSLQLIGPRRSEAGLLNAGRLVETAVLPK